MFRSAAPSKRSCSVELQPRSVEDERSASAVLTVLVTEVCSKQGLRAKTCHLYCGDALSSDIPPLLCPNQYFARQFIQGYKGTIGGVDLFHAEVPLILGNAVGK